MITATGQQLANRLESLACQLRGGKLPRFAGQWLTAGADKAENQLERQAVILAILDMIDPDGCQSVNQSSVHLSKDLRRLNGKPLERIQNGSREATPFEELLVAWIDLDGPKSARRLNDELVKYLTPD